MRKKNHDYSSPDRRTTYLNYLASDHWRGVREGSFKKYGRKCFICGKDHSVIEGETRTLDVHHLFYRQDLWKTRVEDTRPICREHHELWHDIQDERKILVTTSKETWEEYALKGRDMIRAYINGIPFPYPPPKPAKEPLLRASGKIEFGTHQKQPILIKKHIKVETVKAYVPCLITRKVKGKKKRGKLSKKIIHTLKGIDGENKWRDKIEARQWKY